jgi:hypothetical protein
MGDTDIFSDMALIADIHVSKVAWCRSATAHHWQFARGGW